jgi:hypothetical protein
MNKRRVKLTKLMTTWHGNWADWDKTDWKRKSECATPRMKKKPGSAVRRCAHFGDGLKRGKRAAGCNLCYLVLTTFTSRTAPDPWGCDGKWKVAATTQFYIVTLCSVVRNVFPGSRPCCPGQQMSCFVSFLQSQLSNHVSYFLVPYTYRLEVR